MRHHTLIIIILALASIGAAVRILSYEVHVTHMRAARHRHNVAVFLIKTDVDLYLGSTPIAELPNDDAALGAAGAADLVCECATCANENGCANGVCVYTSSSSSSSSSSFWLTPATLDPVAAVYAKYAGGGGESFARTGSNALVAVKRLQIGNEDVHRCRVRFVPGVLVPKPLETGFPTVYRPTCRAFAFADLVDQLQHGIDALKTERDEQRILSLPHTDVWIGCRARLAALTHVGLVHRTLRGTQECFEANGTAAWLADPCCNDALRWHQCCAPRTLSVAVPGVVDVNEVAIHAKCAQPALAVQTLQQLVKHEEDNCEVATESWAARDPMLLSFLRLCSSEIYGEIYGDSTVKPPTCIADADCYTSCDTQRGTCVIPYDEDAGRYLLACYEERMDERLKREWHRQLSAAAGSIRLYDEQCTGPAAAWKHNPQWKARPVLQGCVPGDASCWCGDDIRSHLRSVHERNRHLMSPLDFESAWLALTASMSSSSGQHRCWHSWFDGGDIIACEAELQCNWNPTLIAPDADSGVCAPSTLSSHFCGRCRAAGRCWEVDSVQTAEECAALASENGDNGHCNKPCLRCQAHHDNTTLCHDNKPPAACTGRWDETYGVCIYDNKRSAAECNGDGRVFETCDALSHDAHACATGAGLSAAAQALLRCYPNHWARCATQAECESSATGECDDWDLQNWHSRACWSAADRNARMTADCLGVCVVPQCAEGHVETRLGCVNYNVANAVECAIIYGGKWHMRAFTAAACAAHGSGCREMGGNGRLTPKQGVACTTCNGGRIEPFYNWHAAEWITSSAASTSGDGGGSFTWAARAAVALNRWQPALNYSKVWHSLQSAADSLIAQSVRAALACRVMRPAAVMNTLLCDCESSSSAECYTQTATVSLGAQRIYNGIATSIMWPATAEMRVPADAVQFQSVEGELISATACDPVLFPAPLAMNKRDPYAPDAYDVVVNEHDQIVGRILSSGVNLALPLNQMTPVQLCLLLDDDIPLQADAYPVPDFASYNASTARWSPLEATIVVVGNDAQYCADIIVSGIYFAARRVGEWQNYTTTTASTTSTTTTTGTSTTSTATPTTTAVPLPNTADLSPAAIAAIVVGGAIGLGAVLFGMIMTFRSLGNGMQLRYVRMQQPIQMQMGTGLINVPPPSSSATAARHRTPASRVP